jgi:hypothetical protein
MRGSIRARSDGYEISVSAGVDPVTGKRKRMYRWARTKREAERTLTDLLKAVDSGSFADPGKLTLADYLQGHWLPTSRPGSAPERPCAIRSFSSSTSSRASGR